MSAYMVDLAHIDAIITAALNITRPGRGPLRWLAAEPTAETDRGSWTSEAAITQAQELRRELTPATAGQVGAMLLAENRRSVDHRYDETEIEAPYLYTPYPQELTATQLLMALDGYEYQACEHPGWRTSEAKLFVDALRRAAWQSLPGYQSADTWSISGDYPRATAPLSPYRPVPRPAARQPAPRPDQAAAVAAIVAHVRERARTGTHVDESAKLDVRPNDNAWAFRLPLAGGAYRNGTARADAETGDVLVTVHGPVYGPKYQRNLSTVDVAKLVRDELRAATKDPGSSLHRLTVSVRSEYCSGGSSITATVDGLTDAQIYRPGSEGLGRDGRYTHQARQIIDLVTSALEAYNYHGDHHLINFYTHVNLVDDEGRRWRNAEKDRKRRRRNP